LQEKLKQLKLLMASKARHRRSRLNLYSPNMPTDWGPDKIINPRTGFAFSDDSAWLLIAELLECDEQKVEVVILKLPPGKEAVVIIYDFSPEQSFLYIKIHMGNGNKVIGRSFHLSTRGRNEND
jgi:hypothetical protein